MFSRKLMLALIVVSAVTIPSTVSAEDQGDDQPYSLASLDGEFALVGTYTGGIARQLGVVHFKEGDSTGYLRVNVQGATSALRVVVYLSFAGTTSIADDGTGVVTLTVTYPDGSLHPATLDFLVTKAQERRGPTNRGGSSPTPTSCSTTPRRAPRRDMTRESRSRCPSWRVCSSSRRSSARSWSCVTCSDSPQRRSPTSWARVRRPSTAP